jgi:hypothetical protein
MTKETHVSLDSTTPEMPAPLTPGAPETPAVPADPGVVPTGPVVAGPIGPVVTGASTGSSRTRGSGRFLNIVLGVAVAVAIGGVAFAVGRTTAPVSAATGATQGNGGVAIPRGSFVPGANGGPGFVRGGFAGSPTISGTVESVDGDTLTIKTASGQIITVKTGASTTYHTQAPADVSDVTTGTKVEVQVQLDGPGGAVRPSASGVPTGPVGTAGSVTVVP